MILSITPNPSVDISYRLASFRLNTVNRCSHVHKLAGGKGLNVARVIHLAGRKVCATGFIGGANGQFIKEELDRLQIRHQFVELDGNTRNCIAILHDEGMQTEILEEGPRLTKRDEENFLSQYCKLLDSAVVVTASGSLPKGLDATFYTKLITIAKEKGKIFILDTSGNPLKEGIKASPFLIKPNLQELSGLAGKKLQTMDEVKKAVLSLARWNIPCIVVSLGKDGALGYFGGKFYQIIPPKVQAVNPVGSGDSMVAGMAIALSEGLPDQLVLVYGCAFGTLNAIEEKTGFIRKELLNEFIGKTEVIPI